MKTTIGLAVAALALGGFTILGNGCSSSSTTEVSDSGTTPSDGGKKDSGQVDTDSGPDAPACYDIADAIIGLNGEAAPKAAQGVCQPADITAFRASCFGDSDAADSGGACDDFIAAHAACATCLSGGGADVGSFPSPAIIPVDKSNVSVNIAGCLAAVTSGVDDACKLSFTQASNCESSACSSCSGDTDFSACLDYADADPAGCTNSVPVDSACATSINASGSDATLKAKCIPTAANAGFDDYFQLVATTMCGS